MSQYYTTEEHFINFYAKSYKPYGYHAETPEAYTEWKDAFRQKLETLLGFPYMTKCNPNPVSMGVEQMDGYTREKIVIETEPGVRMPFYMLKPDMKKEKYPVVITPHGHGSSGKMAVCGVDNDIPEIRERINHYNYTYGIQFVKEGFLVFSPDARGFGERREKDLQGDDPEQMLRSSCLIINEIARSLGQCVTGMWTWDLMRLVDYVETREDVDCKRIGAAGLSGGGLQTLWLAAMDDRVRNAIVSGYFYGYNESLLQMHNCSCNYVPGLWQTCDIGDVGALCADRGFFIETGDHDELNGKSGLDNVIPYVDIVRRAAAVVGMPENVTHHIFEGLHRWCGEKSIPWMVERVQS